MEAVVRKRKVRKFYMMNGIAYSARTGRELKHSPFKMDGTLRKHFREVEGFTGRKYRAGRAYHGPQREDYYTEHKRPKRHNTTKRKHRTVHKP